MPPESTRPGLTLFETLDVCPHTLAVSLTFPHHCSLCHCPQPICPDVLRSNWRQNFPKSSSQANLNWAFNSSAALTVFPGPKLSAWHADLGLCASRKQERRKEHAGNNIAAPNENILPTACVCICTCVRTHTELEPMNDCNKM